MVARLDREMPKVWIVVLNWNGRQWLGNCLQSLSDLTYPRYETLLVDNGSTDGSVQYVSERFPWVHILENRENLGFAEGNNRGIGYALENGADMVLVLNNDTKAQADFLQEMVSAATERGVAAVGASVYHMDSERLQEAGMSCDLFGFPVPLETSVGFTEPRECFYVSGSCMLLTREFLEEGGLFDSRYFIFAEDLDLCWRAWLLGYRVMVAPKAIVWHVGGGTVVGGHEKGELYMTQPHRIYLRERNTLCTLLKNYSYVTLAVLGLLYAAVLLLEIVAWSLKARPAAKALLHAVGWNARFLDDTLSLRRQSQIRRRRSDRDIMSRMKFVLGKWVKLQRLGAIRVLSPDQSEP